MRVDAWTEDDITIITENRLMSDLELSYVLGRTEMATKFRRNKLNLLRLVTCKVCGEPFEKGYRKDICTACAPSATEYRKVYNKSIEGRYRTYKEGARRRGFIFELSIEDFEMFWQKPCNYCGDEIETVGIDRVDSSKGYALENAVSCCTMCNQMKLDYDANEWLEQIIKISERL